MNVGVRLAERNFRLQIIWFTSFFIPLRVDIIKIIRTSFNIRYFEGRKLFLKKVSKVVSNYFEYLQYKIV